MHNNNECSIVMAVTWLALALGLGSVLGIGSVMLIRILGG